MSVCFFIWGLRAAGAERVLSFLANTWSAKGWRVTILTMEDGRVAPFYPLDPAIAVRPMDLLRDSASPVSGLGNNLRRVRTLRRAIRGLRPDVVISFIDKANTLAVLATRGLGIPVVVSERTDPSRRSLGRIWNRLRDYAYRRADLVVFQSEAVRGWFPPAVGQKGVVIPNPVPAPRPKREGTPDRVPSRRLVALGRLFPVKGFDVLLRAFAAAAPEAADWTLDIWGEGPEGPALRALAQSLGVTDRVAFRGLTDQPLEVLRGADLYVLPSRAEGFPNALVEAMACGLPVIATDFGGAAREIIRDGIDGLVVPPDDPGAMADALRRLMSDPSARARLAAEAPAVTRRFAPAQVLAQWESALSHVMGRPVPAEGGPWPT